MKAPFTIPAQVTLDSRKPCAVCASGGQWKRKGQSHTVAQQVRVIDYATLSYTQTVKPVPMRKYYTFFLRNPVYFSSSRLQIQNCTNLKYHRFLTVLFYLT